MRLMLIVGGLSIVNQDTWENLVSENYKCKVAMFEIKYFVSNIFISLKSFLDADTYIASFHSN